MTDITSAFRLEELKAQCAELSKEIRELKLEIRIVRGRSRLRISELRNVQSSIGKRLIDLEVRNRNYDVERLERRRLEVEAQVNKVRHKIDFIQRRK